MNHLVETTNSAGECCPGTRLGSLTTVYAIERTCIGGTCPIANWAIDDYLPCHLKRYPSGIFHHKIIYDGNLFRFERSVR